MVWDNQSGSLKRLANTNWSHRLNSDSHVVKTKSKLNIIRIYALTHKHWLVGRPASSLKKTGCSFNPVRAVWLLQRHDKGKLNRQDSRVRRVCSIA